MGTKRQIAPLVSDVILAAKRGPVLDVFSGMCSVGQNIGCARQIWSNDIQAFAALVGSALFTSRRGPPSAVRGKRIFLGHYLRNMRTLKRRYGELLAEEEKSLESSSLRKVETFFRKTERFASRRSVVSERHRLARRPTTFPYRLFAITYPNTFFGLRQCHEIDSIRFSIDQCHRAGTISQDEFQWALVALGQVLTRISFSTGHFAQYLTPKRKMLRRLNRLRVRSVWDEWIVSLATTGPIGNQQWRKRNLAFNKDSTALVRSLWTSQAKPSVVYADPPYTTDQYSRYYHVLETLVHYDYPETTAKGRYRPHRFQSPFSQKTNCIAAFHDLASAVSTLRADLIISYPTDGLLHKLGTKPDQILKQHFSTVKLCHRVSHQHSTLGGPRGSSTTSVTEMIYWAKP